MTDRPVRIAEEPPAADHVTTYDLQHAKIYLRLLDAAAAHADWRDVAETVLGLDPAVDGDRAKRVHDTHLARARWMTTTGYRELAAARRP